MGKGYPKDSNGEQQFLALWKTNGDYNAEATEKDRLQAMKLWREWLTKNDSNGNE